MTITAKINLRNQSIHTSITAANNLTVTANGVEILLTSQQVMQMFACIPKKINDPVREHELVLNGVFYEYCPNHRISKIQIVGNVYIHADVKSKFVPVIESDIDGNYPSAREISLSDRNIPENRYNHNRLFRTLEEAIQHRKDRG